MKYLPLSFLFINLFLFTSAQKQFEGTIIYNLHSNEGKEKDDAELIITFGKNGIKLKVSDGKSSDQSVLMLNFDSGRVYTMEISNKMYRSRRLFTNEKAELPEDKTIAGYKTKAIDALTDRHWEEPLLTVWANSSYSLRIVYIISCRKNIRRIPS